MDSAIEVLASAEAVAERVADLVIAAACRPQLGVLLAGGTTPAAAYRILGARLTAAGAPNLHLWYGDERMVGPNHVDSNARMVRATWLDAAGWPQERDHRIRGELGAVAAAAAITDELLSHAGDKPRFDLALLGVGVDGHTASLFSDETCPDGLFAPARKNARVTATYALLSAAKHVVFMATGHAKANVLSHLWSSTESLLPAAKVAASVRRQRGQVRWIVNCSR